MFETEENLNNHICNYSTAEIEQWGKNHCKVCDMNFARRDLLLSHNLTFHVTEKKFACDQCDFKVNIIRSLILTSLKYKLQIFTIYSGSKIEVIRNINNKWNFYC